MTGQLRESLVRVLTVSATSTMIPDTKDGVLRKWVPPILTKEGFSLPPYSTPARMSLANIFPTFL